MGLLREDGTSILFPASGTCRTARYALESRERQLGGWKHGPETQRAKGRMPSTPKTLGVASIAAPPYAVADEYSVANVAEQW